MPEPHVEPGVDQCAVAVLGEGLGGVEGGQAFERAHVARFDGEGVVGRGGPVDVEHEHDRHAGLAATVDQRVLGGQVGAHVTLGRVGAVTEGFLNVDHYETGLHGCGRGGGCGCYAGF